MQVALLAAGLGSRLGALTERLPKALIEVAGEPLLAYAVRFAQAAGAEEIVVVGGFSFPLVADLVARRRLPVTLVENRDFRDGNLISLFTARPRLRGEFLIMNVDHIYRPAIAALAQAPAQEVTAFIDRDRTLGDDDMKVERDGEGRVRRIAKTLTHWDCGYVGMTKVPAARRRATGPRPRPPAPKTGARFTSSACWRAWPPRAPPRPAGTSAATAGWRSTCPRSATAPRRSCAGNPCSEATGTASRHQGPTRTVTRTVKRTVKRKVGSSSGRG